MLKKLTPKQFNHLADITKETAMIILGGLVVGNLLSDRISKIYMSAGVVFYFGFIYASLYLKKLGE